jgi:hypothetical protein
MYATQWMFAQCAGRLSLLPAAQEVNAAQEAGAAGSSEHRQLCKQLAAALCSLAEMRMGLAEDVSAVSGSIHRVAGWWWWWWWWWLWVVVALSTALCVRGSCRVLGVGGGWDAATAALPAVTSLDCTTKLHASAGCLLCCSWPLLLIFSRATRPHPLPPVLCAVPPPPSCAGVE